MFRNGSVNPTLYLHIEPDPQLAAQDPDYMDYYNDMMGHEILSAIVNKYIVSQPLIVTNDRIPFIIFKSNIDETSLREFCRAVVTEFSFHTGKPHQAKLGYLKTMFTQIDREPMFRFTRKGDKLTRSKLFNEMQEPLLPYEELIDEGIMCPYSAWKEEKRRERGEALRAQEEEVVEW